MPLPPAPRADRSSSCSGATRCSVRWASGADAADLASWHRRRRRAGRARSPHQDDVEHVRRFFEPASNVSQTLYACTAIATSHEGRSGRIGTPLFMRAPGEAPGSIALESAIDEMAQACGMDPLDFRLKNYAEVEPISGKPFSSKGLARMLPGRRRAVRLGAPAVGAAANARSGRLAGRLGRGHRDISGVMFAAQARAVLRRDGSGDRVHRPRQRLLGRRDHIALRVRAPPEQRHAVHLLRWRPGRS